MDGAFNSQNKYVSCKFCVKNFGTVDEFISHLRLEHCTKEGGSFICRYGDNRVCNSLPVEGVSDVDYEHHIIKHHILPINKEQIQKKCSTMSLFLDHVNNEKWTIYSASQNLSAVLNNPAKNKPKDFFTKQWGDSFVEVTHVHNPSYLPNITKQHFETYLKKATKRLRRHSRINRNTESESQSSTLLQHFPTLRTLKTSEKTVPDISAIPDVFLKNDFNLSCKDVFSEVFPNISESEKSNENIPVLQTSWNSKNFSGSSKVLQEKLSYYLDIVEVQIARQVSLKADAFFHTMTSHDTLMEQLGQTISKVCTLREKIHKVNNNLVIDSLRILRGVRCRSNYALVLQKLKVMSTVYKTQPTVKLLLSNLEYVGALELIYGTKDLLNNQLAGVLCFRHLSSELNEMINTIDTLMIEEFERYAINDLNRPLLEEEINFTDADKLFCIILGMLRRECFSFTNSYVKEANSTIKAIFKQNIQDIIVSNDSQLLHNTTNESHSQDEQLKSFSVNEWMILLRNTANCLVHLLKRIKAMHDIMFDAVNISAGKISSCGNNEDALYRKSLVTGNSSELLLDEESYNIMMKKLSNVLSLPCQYAIERYSHLLSQKSLSDYQENEDGKVSFSSNTQINGTKTLNNGLSEQATLEQLKQISHYVDLLCSTCEELCSVESIPKMMRSVFKSEIRKFMLKFHYERMIKISLILESESWDRADVPQEFQQLVDKIYKFGKFTTYKAEMHSTLTNKPNSILFVGEEKFVAVGTILLLIIIVAEYCVHAEDTILSASSLLRYITELLHSFNSKCCRLVLGAEAVSDKTGKKKITSANLALLLRALQLLLSLIPKIQDHFTGLLPDGCSSTPSLDRVADELHEHIEDINAKLVSIVAQVITAELRTWEAKPPIPSKPFQNISRYLFKFFGAISNILRTEDLHCLYNNINDAFKNVLKEHIGRMNIVNNGGPQHGIVTQELIFYIEDLKKVAALPRDELNLESMQDIWL